MSDIFISYSRKDSEQALQLAELLTSAGLSCWIDRHNIEAASSWSGEIVDAIDGCKAFVVLLSTSSGTSHNVAKEVALASERRKRILPLDLEPIVLPRDLAYHLAGIQRSSMSNIDSIIRALEKMGLEATSAPSIKLVRETDARKSLMILPFEDLSPTGDNGWFTDGMASELIAALSKVKSLRVIDWNTSREYKDQRIRTTILAKELEVRYFIEGQVRKFGDQIKISITLLDVETGDHLWQESMKGTMEDVFDIQEKAAEKVVDGLNIHLAVDEKKKLEQRGTSNLEAYELYLKCGDYLALATKKSFQLAIQQLTLAIELDPNYALALGQKAFVLVNSYRLYDLDPETLSEAEALAQRAIAIDSDVWNAHSALSGVYRLQGKIEEAEAVVVDYVRRFPQEFRSHFSLGHFYLTVGRPSLATEYYANALKLKPDLKEAYFSIVLSCDRARDSEGARYWATMSLPYFERRIRLAPDDDSARVHYSNLLQYAGHQQRAIKALEPLRSNQDLDSNSLYNIGCLYARLNDPDRAIESLDRAIKAGCSDDTFSTDPDLDPLRELPEFKRLMRIMEERRPHE